MRRLLPIAFLALLAAPLSIPAPARAALPANVERVARKGPVTEYRLRSNGMPILLVPRHNAPVATFMVVYHVGSRNEFPGCTGSAHLLEHMLFNKSTEHFWKAGGHKTIQVALREVGVDFSSTNMTTWNDRMNGYSTVPSDRLELAMQVEADRMQTAKILDSERQPEMSVVRNEYEIGENSPGEALSKAVVGAAIVAHPYHWDTIGYRSDIEGVSTEQLRAHYRNYFWPDNSSAILVGDFEPDAALAMFDRYFGKMPKAPAPIPKVITVEPEQEGERRVTVSRPGNVGYVILAYPRPGTLDADWHALDVLATILGSGRNARLYQALVETGLANEVDCRNYALRDPYLVMPYAELAPGAGHAKTEAAILAALDSVRVSGVSQAEVDRAVRGIEVGLASSRDGVYGMAAGLGEAVASANWQWFVDYLDVVRKVTPADVQRVARKYLVPGHLTAGWFVPKQGEPLKTGALEGGTPGARPQEPAQSGAAEGGSPGPWGMLMLPEVSVGSSVGGTVSTPPGFAGRTVRRAWPRRLVLDVLPNPGAPTVAISGLLRAGSILAPADKPELAAVTAGMLSRGTATRSKLDLAGQLESLGASMGFTAGVYDLNFDAYGMSRDLPVLLDLLADQLLHPSFPEEELRKLKLQRRGQLLSQAENTGARAQETLFQVVFPDGHPLRPTGVLDRASSVEKLTAADVRDFYTSRYRGGSLVLTVVGDVDAAAVVKLVEEKFAGLVEGEPPVLDLPRAQPGPPQRRAVTMRGKANMDLLLGMYGGVRRLDPDYYPCILANAVFGLDALTSRTGRRIRDTEGLTYNLYSRFFGADLLEGTWGLDIAVAPQNLDKAMASARDELAKFCRDGVTQAELDAQKSFYAGNFKVRLATNTGVAQQLAYAEKFGFGPGYLDRYPGEIQAVTLAQVNEAIRRHFDPAKVSVIVAGDLDSLPVE
ncbi:MAG: insulinase family protein [Candidatus Eisenbacteria bacterium]|nr:insulinase family protein [Candidatus Eisenbacteria bacterium]